jgi:hypothetical protein
MAKPRFTLYKHIKIGGTWRYCRTAVAVNNKVKPHIVVVGGTEEKHEDGSYCIRSLIVVRERRTCPRHRTRSWNLDEASIGFLSADLFNARVHRSITLRPHLIIILYRQPSPSFDPLAPDRRFATR